MKQDCSNTQEVALIKMNAAHWTLNTTTYELQFVFLITQVIMSQGFQSWLNGTSFQMQMNKMKNDKREAWPTKENVNKWTELRTYLKIIQNSKYASLIKSWATIY